jgi:hypothetical protein
MQVRRLLALLGGVALAGCAAVADLGNVALWDGGTGAGELDATTGGGDGASGDAGPDVSTVPCTGSCAPAVPQGWQGPLVLYEGLNDGGALPACPSHTGSGNQVFRGLDGSVSCSTCTCGSGAGAQCGPIVVDQFTSVSCTVLQCTATLAAPGSCGVGCASTAAAKGFSATPQVADSGACPADGGVATTSFAFATAGETCSAPAGTGACAGGGACITAAPSPFSGATCVLASGDVPCPVGYATQHLYFQGVDTSAAGCSPCTCSTPSVSCSGAEIEPQADTLCTEALPPTEPVPTTCAISSPFDPAAAYLWVAGSKLTATSSPCVADGGRPQGTATPTGPVTVCCTP